MLSSSSFFVLLGLAAAAPLESRQNPVYPETTLSKGFRLVANVTDSAHDLTPSVQGQLLSGIHTGAGLSLAVVTNSTNNERIFYQNGTAEEVHNREGTLLTDSGSTFAWGLVVGEAENSESSVSINGGSGTKHVQLSTHPEPYSYVVKDAQGSFAVCSRPVPYYQNKAYPVVLFFTSNFNSGTAQYESTVPQECAAIKLLPECANLPESSVDHANAQDSRCYQSVKDIDWTKYAAS